VKELADILRRDRELRSANIDSALATVVRVQGSSYRRPGARMLISSDGQITGGVSGGCLERDVVLRAGAVMSTGQPALVRYDTTIDTGGGTGYSLGCGGTIDVLIESLRSPSGIQLLQWLQASQETRQALVTVVSKHTPRALLGQRMVVLESGQFDGQMIDHDSSIAIAELARAAMKSGRASCLHYLMKMDLFVEVLNPPLKLFVFGAGNDAVPLVGFARSLGWVVTVVDVRSSPFDPGRSWEVDYLIRCNIREARDRVAPNASAAAVVMTHNFSHDHYLVQWLSTLNLRYLGLLGPRHRTEQLLSDLHVDGLRSPVGLDLGADNPEEVALAIVAEITAVLHGRSGVALSAREGPIHNASPQENRAVAAPDAITSVERPGSPTEVEMSAGLLAESHISVCPTAVS
jgi:xanthine dehydrogenase accessory factor